MELDPTGSVVSLETVTLPSRMETGAGPVGRRWTPRHWILAVRRVGRTAERPRGSPARHWRRHRPHALPFACWAPVTTVLLLYWVKSA